jgi:NADPH:quinone reductase-like Zn-dependent oxidoreductase
MGGTSVKAVFFMAFGDVDVLEMVEVAEPLVAPGEVLVAMRATSVNILDSRMRKGLLGRMVDRRFPKIPGGDVCGVVVEAGSEAVGFVPGDAVYGAVDPFKGGAFAERIAVPVAQLAPKPPELSFPEAAAVPINGLAALHAIRDLGQVVAGNSVLIHGASGAVGLFAIQIAKHLGAHVTAVTGTEGLAAVLEAGADDAIDFRKTGGQQFTQRFDMILNASRVFGYSVARRFLKRGGRLVEPSPTIADIVTAALLNPFRSAKHLILETMPTRKDLADLNTMIAQGVLKPHVARIYRLEEARAAFTELETGTVVGKLVVTIAT